MSEAAGDVNAKVSRLIEEIIAACKRYERNRVRDLCQDLRKSLRASGRPPTDKEARGLLNALRSARIFDELALIGGLIVMLGGRGPRVRKLQAQGLIEGQQIAAAVDVIERLVADIFGEREQAKEAAKAQADIDALTDEYADSIALLGRAHKQTYVDLIDPERPDEKPSPTRVAAMMRAIQNYKRAFQEARPSQKDFPGVNLLALVARARRDGIAVDPSLDVASLAAEVEKAVDVDPSRKRKDPWAMASLAEASLAKGDLEAAADWFGLYAYHPNVDAFALGGTIRQLEEVWGERVGKERAGPILAVLKSRLLQLEGGSVAFTKEERSALSGLDANGLGDLPFRVMKGAGEYETKAAAAPAQAATPAAVQGASPPPAAPASAAPATAPGPQAMPQKRVSESGAYIDFMLMLKIVERGKAVARICDGPGNPAGTGFLVRGSELSDAFANEVLVVTNSHVVSKHGSTMPGTMPLAPQRARIVFDAEVLEGRETLYKCELMWESPPGELDCAVLRLVPTPPGFQPIPLAAPDLSLVPELASTGAAATRLVVIGHPEGASLKISIDTQQRSTLVDMGTKPPGPESMIYLHYRTSTDPGSSGSPVLDEQTLSLVGLHRAGPAKLKGTIPRLNGVGGDHEANEGVFVGSIKRLLTASPPASPAPGSKPVVRPQAPVASAPVPQGASQAASAPAARVMSAPVAVKAWEPLMAPPRPTAAAAPLPRIGYTELIARLANPDVPNASLAGYFRSVPNAGSAYNPVFTVDTSLVDVGLAATDSGETGRIAGYLNAFSRLERQQSFRRRIAAGYSGLKLMAEGDSWFEYPLIGDDVIDHLMADHAVYCLASSNDTMASVLSDTNFKSEIEPALIEIKPEAFLLSIGGGAIVGERLLDGLKDYAPGLQARDYLTSDFSKSLLQLSAGISRVYDRLLATAAQYGFPLRILAHGYDLPAPRPGGPWLHAPMERKGIVAPALQAEIVRQLLDRLAGMHQSLAARYRGKVIFVDCRGVVGDAGWQDELHPSAAGFRKIADRFKAALTTVTAPQVEAAVTRIAPPLPHAASRSSPAARA